MKKHHTSKQDYIDVLVHLPGGKKTPYHILNSDRSREELNAFLKRYSSKPEIDPWEQATPWENLAKERIEKYKKTGLVLRGARFREGLSQNELAKRTGISQDNLSKIENGKRTVGEKVAKRLAKELNIDYKLLIAKN